jgi:hypothetical protein
MGIVAKSTLDVSFRSDRRRHARRAWFSVWRGQSASGARGSAFGSAASAHCGKRACRIAPTGQHGRWRCDGDAAICHVIRFRRRSTRCTQSIGGRRATSIQGQTRGPGPANDDAFSGTCTARVCPASTSTTSVGRTQGRTAAGSGRVWPATRIWWTAASSGRVWATATSLPYGCYAS